MFRSVFFLSALLVIVAYCGYPVAEYVVPPSSYVVPKKYSVVPAPPPPSNVYQASASDSESETFDSESDSSFRKRAKARTAHNRQFQRRALQPMRRFQQKKAKQ
uniref:Secreted protein n=1 Tax=Caenorhabditis japonica TaxID=281687 RepID=A0A8R1HZI5_CAEJA